jgi:hypothetical protein
MNICNVVLVVQDDLKDKSIINYIKTLLLLKSIVPSLFKDNTPDIIFIYNKLSINELNQININKIEKKLNKSFKDCGFNKKGSIHPNKSDQTEEVGVNFYFLPCEIETDDYMSDFKSMFYKMQKSKFDKNLDLNEWYKNSKSCWDSINKSHQLSEYFRCFQKLGLYK